MITTNLQLLFLWREKNNGVGRDVPSGLVWCRVDGTKQRPVLPALFRPVLALQAVCRVMGIAIRNVPANPRVSNMRAQVPNYRQKACVYLKSMYGAKPSANIGAAVLAKNRAQYGQRDSP